MNETIRVRGREEVKCAEGHKTGSDQFILSELPISVNEVKACNRGSRGTAHAAMSV